MVTTLPKNVRFVNLDAVLDANHPLAGETLVTAVPANLRNGAPVRLAQPGAPASSSASGPA